MAHLAAKKQKFIESIERSVVELQDLEKKELLIPSYNVLPVRTS